MTQSALHHIKSDELDALLTRIQQEKCQELVLLGPKVRLNSSPNRWPEVLKGHTVFRLTQVVDDLAYRLAHLDQLHFLVLWNIQIDEAGAKAIAENLKQLNSLDLRSNQIGNAGTKAIMEDCRRLWSTSKYANMHPELLALMAKFELCYLVPDEGQETWLAPQLLSPSKPTRLNNW